VPSEYIKQSDKGKLDAMQIRKREPQPKGMNQRYKNSEKANWKDLELDIMNERKEDILRDEWEGSANIIDNNVRQT
jgi:hypothetical protein